MGRSSTWSAMREGHWHCVSPFGSRSGPVYFDDIHSRRCPEREPKGECHVARPEGMRREEQPRGTRPNYRMIINTYPLTKKGAFVRRLCLIIG